MDVLGFALPQAVACSSWRFFPSFVKDSWTPVLLVKAALAQRWARCSEDLAAHPDGNTVTCPAQNSEELRACDRCRCPLTTLISRETWTKSCLPSHHLRHIYYCEGGVVGRSLPHPSLQPTVFLCGVRRPSVQSPMLLYPTSCSLGNVGAEVFCEVWCLRRCSGGSDTSRSRIARFPMHRGKYSLAHQPGQLTTLLFRYPIARVPI